MLDVPWPTTSNPGAAPGEGSGRVINCLAYKDGEGARWRPVPGLDSFAEVPASEIRGGIVMDGLAIVAVGSQVTKVDGGGGQTPISQPLPGDGPVTVARNNNAVSPTVTITTSIGAFIIANDVVREYPSPNLPLVNSVCYLDGYFLFTCADGRIFASELNSTDVNALSFTTAEARLDGLLRGVVYGQQFLAFGSDTIEVYDDAGTLPFPLSRSAVIRSGLIGQWAIAGFEDGWGGPLIYVAQDGSVRRLDGYTPTRISSEDLERLISKVMDRSQLRASVYTFGGNAIWSLSGPGFTWEFNVTTSEWHERASYRMARWRGGFTLSAFGKWLVGDVAGGKLYLLNADARQEGDTPLVWGMDSGPVKNFPQRIQVPAAYFDFVLGQAAIDGGKPEAMISWSHDGGGQWANPVTRSLQAIGRFFGRVAVNRLGLSTHHGIRLRFRVLDPAYSSFAGARIEGVGRR